MTFGPAFASVLAAAQTGAPWALDRIYRELASAVSGYLRVQGSAAPDELTSDVFLKVLGGITEFSGTEERFRSWVFTIAHHRLIDERRRQARRPATAGDHGLDQTAMSQARAPEDAEAEAMRWLSLERVRRLCDRLAPDQRDTLLLRMIGDMTLEQTAEALGKSVGAVKALQHRGLAALRRILEREGVSL